jgi:hypothetical protein
MKIGTRHWALDTSRWGLGMGHWEALDHRDDVEPDSVYTMLTESYGAPSN